MTKRKERKTRHKTPVGEGGERVREREKEKKEMRVTLRLALDQLCTGERWTNVKRRPGMKVAREREKEDNLRRLPGQQKTLARRILCSMHVGHVTRLDVALPLLMIRDNNKNIAYILLPATHTRNMPFTSSSFFPVAQAVPSIFFIEPIKRRAYGCARARALRF